MFNETSAQKKTARRRAVAERPKTAMQFLTESEIGCNCQHQNAPLCNCKRKPDFVIKFSHHPSGKNNNYYPYQHKQAFLSGIIITQRGAGKQGKLSCPEHKWLQIKRLCCTNRAKFFGHPVRQIFTSRTQLRYTVARKSG